MNRRLHGQFHDRRHEVYSVAIYVVGAAALFLVALTARLPRLDAHSAALVSVLGLFVVLGELFPIAIRR
ncbi:MAG: hypothetical protein ACRDV8_02325, partial [Acidimicrobiales bacterium]